MSTPTDDQQIRQLILQWAAAVNAGDLDLVMADHADDIVMFDVPPPENGVRGRDAYREVWSPFFEYQASGACFDLVELNIVAGTEVAYAYGLLRCGSPAELAANPAQRLRLSLGLVKRADRWQVQHEHHSFTDSEEVTLDNTGNTSAGERDTAPAEAAASVSTAATTDQRSDSAAVSAIQAIHDDWFAATAARDLDGIMAHIDPAVVSYEHDSPLAYIGAPAVRSVCAAGLASGPVAVSWTIPDLTILTEGDLAVAWGVNEMSATLEGGQVEGSWSRGSRVFQRHDGEWRMVHQHVSYPYDPVTGAARTDLAADDIITS